MTRKATLALLSFLFWSFSLWTAPQREETQTPKIRIAAAANMAAVEKPLTEAFQAKFPGIILQWSFASSGALTNQILSGAPYDLFLSADTTFPQKVFHQGFASSEPRVYAKGLLILFTNKGLDLSLGLELLSAEGTGQFTLANPETAPYGKAAKQALVKKGLWERVSAQAVYGQSITQAKQMALVATGLGLLHKSALGDQDMKNSKEEGIHWVNVDPDLYAPLNQALVVLKEASQETRLFEEFILGNQGREILVKAGYGVP